jgi:CRP/FNR family cyclic AMP-dependent transcriptional regulator
MGRSLCLPEKVEVSMNNREYIKKLAFFSDLDNESLDKIAQIMIERKYKKNMIIFMAGEPAEAVFFVKKGKVKIYKTTQDGKEHIIHIMSDGDVFAEACLFGVQPYPANAEAMDDSEIVMIKNKDLEHLLELHPQIAIQIIKVLSTRLKMVSSQIENLALRDAYGKTASLLIQLLKNEGVTLKNGATLKTELSRQDMANMVGLTRETFTRALSKLKQDKAIDIDKEQIIVLDFEKLKSWIY